MAENPLAAILGAPQRPDPSSTNPADYPMKVEIVGGPCHTALHTIMAQQSQLKQLQRQFEELKAEYALNVQRLWGLLSDTHPQFADCDGVGHRKSPDGRLWYVGWNADSNVTTSEYDPHFPLGRPTHTHL